MSILEAYDFVQIIRNLPNKRIWFKATCNLQKEKRDAKELSFASKPDIILFSLMCCYNVPS